VVLPLPEFHRSFRLVDSTLPTHDARFVISCSTPDYPADWVKGAWGGADFWVRVDNFIRRKGRGDIPSEF
jgi:hypothetical protein